MVNYLGFNLGLILVLASLLCLSIVGCRGLKKSDHITENITGNNTLINSSSLEIQQPLSLQKQWVVDATEAKQLIEQGATLLDARGGGRMKRLQGAISVNWKQFSPQNSPQNAMHRGKIIDNDQQLTEQLQAIGISTNTPVIVFADPPNGWGEDGRIVWMLRTLGHSQAVMVDGGFAALVNANIPIQLGKKLAPTPGDFVVRRNLTWDIKREEIREKLDAENLVIIDTREPREFAGRTPYGEQRGGHIPGAVNLYFKEFLRQDGMLLSKQEIITKLGNAGITSDAQIVVYCTGGIRSGWLTSVLVPLGFEVKNYAGSMWEWSALPPEYYPLF